MLNDGSTRPIEMQVSETVNVGDAIGTVIAKDADENPRIYYYIIGGNQDLKFALDKDTGIMSLAAEVDSEVQSQYSLDVMATNNVSDYSVITNRRKRAPSPDIVTILINVRNTNDAPPVFEKSSYTGCISTRASIGQSIVTVYAADQDSFGGVTYSIDAGNTDNGMEIGSNSGTIYNRVLMADFVSRGITQINLKVNASDNQLTDQTGVLIFVTQLSNEVELVVTQPPLEVRQFVDQIKTTFESLTKDDGSPEFKFVCISAVKDHVTSGENQNSYWSDVYLSAICEECFGRKYYIYSSAALLNILNTQYKKNKEPFDLLYIKSLDVADDEPTYLDDTPAMVVMIIVLILLFFVILFVIFCACCIHRSKQKSKRDLEQRVISGPSKQEPIQSLNPLYDNKGFVLDEPPEDQYAKVQKTFIDTRPREPIPEPMEVEVTGPESIDAVLRDNDDESESSQSDTSSPPLPRRIEEPLEEYRIETEVVQA